MQSVKGEQPPSVDIGGSVGAGVISGAGVSEQSGAVKVGTSEAVMEHSSQHLLSS